MYHRKNPMTALMVTFHKKLYKSVFYVIENEFNIKPKKVRHENGGGLHGSVFWCKAFFWSGYLGK